jgi:hypothetical protein
MRLSVRNTRKVSLTLGAATECPDERDGGRRAPGPVDFFHADFIIASIHRMSTKKKDPLPTQSSSHIREIASRLNVSHLGQIFRIVLDEQSMLRRAVRTQEPR